MNTDDAQTTATKSMNTMTAYNLSSQLTPLGIHQNESTATNTMNMPMHRSTVHTELAETKLRGMFKSLRP